MAHAAQCNLKVTINIIKTTQNVSLVATSNVFAEYYDCGCPKAPLGGLARKAFFFKNMMSEREPLLVDAGNTFFSHGVINPDGLRVNQKKYKARNKKIPEKNEPNRLLEGSFSSVNFIFS